MAKTQDISILEKGKTERPSASVLSSLALSFLLVLDRVSRLDSSDAVSKPPSKETTNQGADVVDGD